jgi:hypothetical protein
MRPIGRLTAALASILAILMLESGVASAHSTKYLAHKRMQSYQLFRRAQQDARAARAVDPKVVVKHKRRAQHWLARFRYWRNLHVWRLRYLKIPSWGKSWLRSTAACESGGNPRAISSGGTYRGKYQFDYRTWGEAGGSGDPAKAPENEQDVRAYRLMRHAGTGRWPVCG